MFSDPTTLLGGKWCEMFPGMTLKDILPKISQTRTWGCSCTKKDLFYMSIISVMNNNNKTGIYGYVGVESF